MRFIPKPECSVFGCRFCPTFFHKNFLKSFWLSTFLKFEIFIFLLFIFHCCGYRVFICFHFNREIGPGKKTLFFRFFQYDLIKRLNQKLNFDFFMHLLNHQKILEKYVIQSLVILKKEKNYSLFFNDSILCKVWGMVRRKLFGLWPLLNLFLCN